MPQPPAARSRIRVTLVVLAVIALALYGLTLFRFDIMLGGGR